MNERLWPEQVKGQGEERMCWEETVDNCLLNIFLFKWKTGCILRKNNAYI